jgi:sporulation protein YlmC with PRC-barrel domain
MRVNLGSILGFQVSAQDGELGHVHDCYFDDHDRIIRYFVVDTRKWLLGRRVLISPASVGAPDFEKRLLPVNLTKTQVRHSPDFNTDLPVSLQHEELLAQHYEWPQYWDGLPFGSVVGMPLAAAEPVLDTPHGDPHLRSVAEVRGYDAWSQTVKVGTVKEIIADSETWKILAFLIDDGKTPFEIPAENTGDIDWQEERVEILR